MKQGDSDDFAQSRPMVVKANARRVLVSEVTISGEDYASYSIAWMVTGGMMMLTGVILLLCSAFLVLIRYRARKDSQRELSAHQKLLNQIKSKGANDPQANVSPYILTPQQKLLKIQQDRLAGPRLIETRATDLAGVVSYLAENRVDDEDIEYRAANRNVLLVSQHP